MSLILVWAGGSGMSALAQLMVDLSLPNIVCIDQAATPQSEQLAHQGVKILVWHGIYTVQPGDFVIYSAATKNTPEVAAWFQHFEDNHLHFPPMLYAQFLGELSKYLYTIAVTGTHGKSTTTGLTAVAAIAHLPQTALAIVGAGVTDRNGRNVRRSKKYTDYLKQLILHITSRKHNNPPQPLKKLIFIVEADEFNHHFLRLHPDISIITTIDYDHIDTYPTRDDYLQAFRQFVQNTNKEVLLRKEDVAVLALPPEQQKKICVITPHQFTFSHLLGGHNHANASLAQAAIEKVMQQKEGEIHTEAIQQTIATYTWLTRRAELIGHNAHHVPVFSDYGHHPHEIQSTLLALKERCPDKKIICLFQPHQARRLLEFRDAFVDACQQAEQIWVVPCYTAREQWDEIVTHLPTQLSQIGNFDELTQAFATQAGATYLRDDKEVATEINKVKEGIIISFSAGDLDGRLRGLVTWGKD